MILRIVVSRCSRWRPLGPWGNPAPAISGRAVQDEEWPFKAIDGLRKVPGIGPPTFNAIQDLATLVE